MVIALGTHPIKKVRIESLHGFNIVPTGFDENLKIARNCFLRNIRNIYWCMVVIFVIYKFIILVSFCTNIIR